jgi:hypothetical protein
MVTAQLADVLVAGVRLDFSADPDRPVFQVPRGQSGLVASLVAPETKPQTQHLLRQVAEYRSILLHLFRLATAGPTAARHEIGQALQDEMRLHDDLGPRLARLILTAVEQEYHAATGLCAYCGEQH